MHYNTLQQTQAAYSKIKYIAATVSIIKIVRQCYSMEGELLGVVLGCPIWCLFPVKE